MGNWSKLCNFAEDLSTAVRTAIAPGVCVCGVSLVTTRWIELLCYWLARGMNFGTCVYMCASLG